MYKFKNTGPNFNCCEKYFLMSDIWLGQRTESQEGKSANHLSNQSRGVRQIYPGPPEHLSWEGVGTNERCLYDWGVPGGSQRAAALIETSAAQIN